MTLADIARRELGTQEDSAHSNRGEAIRKYQEATSLTGQGWPWCAAFVDWCVQDYMQQGAPLKLSAVPRTAQAFGLIQWALDNHCVVFCPYEFNTRYVFYPEDVVASPGDIVVYTFSHCGIVSRVGGEGHDFHAIEGNTNNDGSRDGYEVAERGRAYGSVRQFIRLPGEIL